MNHQIILIMYRRLWKPPAGYSFEDFFLRRLEKELFLFLAGKPRGYNLAKEEWQEESF